MSELEKVLVARRVSEEIRLKIDKAFESVALQAATAPILCNRALVTKAEDSNTKFVNISLGGAAFSGDPNGSSSDGVYVAQAPVAVAMPETAALNLMIGIAHALGSSIELSEDKRTLKIERQNG